MVRIIKFKLFELVPFELWVIIDIGKNLISKFEESLILLEK